MSTDSDEYGEGTSRRKIVVSILAIIFAIYVVAAPYITVHQMRDAAKQRDGEALSEHIDFPSVRQSIKDQLNAKFAKAVSEDKEMSDSALAPLGMAFASVVIDKAIDVYVTPAGIAQLMAGENLQPDTDREGGRHDSADREPLSEASMSYEAISKFSVRVKNEDGEEVKFVFRRRGIGWKMTDIIIPPD
jgi:hypothetical protein